MCVVWPSTTCPLERRKSTDQEQTGAHHAVGKHYTDPDLHLQRLHEREHSRLHDFRFLYHDTDAKVHEGFGKVDSLFSFIGDGEWRYTYIGFLQQKFRNCYVECVLLN